MTNWEGCGRQGLWPITKILARQYSEETEEDYEKQYGNAAFRQKFEPGTANGAEIFYFKPACTGPDSRAD
jgi:hypothetical protein